MAQIDETDQTDGKDGKDDDVGSGPPPWVVGVVAALVVGVFVFVLKGQPFATTDPAGWGQFGDYFGGLMNPLIAFSAFLWLATSVKIQKRELKTTREALEKQAATSLLAARIQTLNIELSSVVGYLQHLRTKQLRISELQNRLDRPQTYVNEAGVVTGLDRASKDLYNEILGFQKEEARVLGEIRELSSKLT